MNRKENLKSSFRILKRNRIRTFFMILGIVVSMTALVLTFTLGKGFEKQMTQRLEKYLGSNSLVIATQMKIDGRPFENDVVSTLTLEDMKVIAEQVSSVQQYDPVQIAAGREVINGNKSITTTIKGGSVNSEWVWNRGVCKGEFFNVSDVSSSSRVALIGTEVAAKLFTGEDPVGKSIRIDNIPFVIKGVLDPKGVDPHGNDLDLDVLIPISTIMSRVLNVDYIMYGKFVLSDENRMDEAIAGINSILQQRHHINDANNADFMILTPDFAKEKLKEMSKIFRVFLPLISLIALFVAGILITILMLIAVNERRSEIGLRKATGARSRDILIQFLTEISFTSLLGGIIGLFIGLGLFSLVSIKMALPFNPPVVVFIGSFILPVIIGLVAGLFPAQKAANLNPVEALR